MSNLLTPSGYKDIATVVVGDAVSAFDLASGTAITNTVERVEVISKQSYQECNAPQGYNDGEAPPTLKPGDVPFKFYRINDQWTLFQDQSIWYLRVPGAEANVCHVSDLQVGDTLFDENDNSVVITSIVEQDGDGWTRFAISGDHSYIVDGLTLHNASRYGVGSGLTTNVNATGNTNWSASSGGSNNASVPGTSDACFFDSNTNAGWSVAILSAAITVQNWDFNGYTGTLVHNTAVTLTCNTAGTFRFSAGMTYTPASATSLVQFTHTSGTMNLTSNGIKFAALTINGAGGTTQQQDDLVCNQTSFSSVTFNCTAGSFDCNGHSFITAVFAITGNATKSFICGSFFGIGYNSGGAATIFNINSLTGTTFTKGTCDITINYSAGAVVGWAFASVGLTYNNLIVNIPAGSTLLFNSGATNTYNSIVNTFGCNIFTQGSIVVTTPINWAGSKTVPILVAGLGALSLSCPSGTCTISYAALSNLQGVGGAAFSATNMFAVSGNTTGWNVSLLGQEPPIVSYQRAIKAGATSQSVDVFVKDNTGAPLTGLLYNSSGLTAYYRKGATGASTSFVLATQTVGGAYSSGGFVEIDATHMPGMYRLDVPDTILAATPNATIYLQGAANMVPVIVELEIVGYDPTDATALGLSRFDAAVSTRMATFSYTAPDNADIAAIKAKTDNLPAAPADESLIIAAANSLATSIAALPTTTTVNAIKAKTDNLPASPSATGDAMTLTSAYDAAKTAAQASDIPSADISDIKTVADGLPTFVHTAGKLWVLDGNGNAVAPASQTQAIQDKTDNLPDDPADKSLVIAATNSLASAIAALPSASQNATALLTSADAVDSLTPQEAFKIMLAALAGKVSGLSGTTATFRDTDDTVDRIVATVDANGDRSAVTLNGT